MAKTRGPRNCALPSSITARSAAVSRISPVKADPRLPWPQRGGARTASRCGPPPLQCDSQPVTGKVLPTGVGVGAGRGVGLVGVGLGLVAVGVGGLPLGIGVVAVAVGVVALSEGVGVPPLDVGVAVGVVGVADGVVGVAL